MHSIKFENQFLSIANLYETISDTFDFMGISYNVMSLTIKAKIFKMFKEIEIALMNY